MTGILIITLVLIEDLLIDPTLHSMSASEWKRESQEWCGKFACCAGELHVELELMMPRVEKLKNEKEDPLSVWCR